MSSRQRPFNGTLVIDFDNAFLCDINEDKTAQDIDGNMSPDGRDYNYSYNSNLLGYRTDVKELVNVLTADKIGKIKFDKLVKYFGGEIRVELMDKQLNEMYDKDKMKLVLYSRYFNSKRLKLMLGRLDMLNCFDINTKYDFDNNGNGNNSGDYDANNSNIIGSDHEMVDHFDGEMKDIIEYCQINTDMFEDKHVFTITSKENKNMLDLYKLQQKAKLANTKTTVAIDGIDGAAADDRDESTTNKDNLNKSDEKQEENKDNYKENENKEESNDDGETHAAATASKFDFEVIIVETKEINTFANRFDTNSQEAPLGFLSETKLLEIGTIVEKNTNRKPKDISKLVCVYNKKYCNVSVHKMSKSKIKEIDKETEKQENEDDNNDKNENKNETASKFDLICDRLLDFEEILCNFKLNNNFGNRDHSESTVVFKPFISMLFKKMINEKLNIKSDNGGLNFKSTPDETNKTNNNNNNTKGNNNNANNNNNKINVDMGLVTNIRHKLRFEMCNCDCHYSLFKNGGYRVRIGLIGIPKDNKYHSQHLRLFESSINSLNYKNDHCSIDGLLLQSDGFKEFECYYLSFIYNSSDKRYVCRFGKNNNPFYCTLYFSENSKSNKMMKDEFYLKKNDIVDICIDYQSQNKKYYLYFVKNSKSIIGSGSGGGDERDRNKSNNSNSKSFKNGKFELNFDKYDFLYALSSARCGCKQPSIKGFEFQISQYGNIKLSDKAKNKIYEKRKSTFLNVAKHHRKNGSRKGGSNSQSKSQSSQNSQSKSYDITVQPYDYDYDHEFEVNINPGHRQRGKHGSGVSADMRNSDNMQNVQLYQYDGLSLKSASINSMNDDTDIYGVERDRHYVE